ncbi:MAG: CPBP family intramembrane metalloprotease [Bacteroidales bacterium]|nr:CPBP family intramembrane metalloprotease [Bacteroidales bacterium]
MFREPPLLHFSPFLKILSLIMIMIVAFFIVLAIGVTISLPFFGTALLDSMASMNNYADPRYIIALKYFQIVNQIGVFIAPAIVFVIFTDDDFRRYLYLRGKIKWFSLLFGVLLLILSLPFISWLVEINNNIHLPETLSGIETWMRDAEDNARRLTDAFLATSHWGGFLVNLLMIAVLAAIGEELVFRGVLVRLFREWTHNIHLAVIITAFLFSALHLQFYGFFGRFLLGILLGYLFVWSGSLWVPIFVHFMNNAIAVLISFLGQRGVIDTDLDTFGSSQNIIIITGSFFLMVFTMALIYLHEQGYFRKRARDAAGQE